MKILLYQGAGIAAPHIVNSVIKALKTNGHRIRIVHLKHEKQNITRELDRFSPELILALDGTGLDYNILNKNRIYYCSWFVDNPRYFITEEVNSEFHIGAYSDKSFIPILKKLGFKHLIYLPLAFDKDIFHKKEFPIKYIADISYVGSFSGTSKKLREKRQKELNPNVNKIIETALSILKNEGSNSFNNILEKVEQHLKISFLDKIEIPAIGGILYNIDLAFDVWNKTKFYNIFKEYNLHIYGNPNWKELDFNNKNFKGFIDYTTSLANIYRTTKINIVLTRPQIVMGVNQRIFDIPAVGSFMLCDYKDELKEIFPNCWQQISYHNLNELQDKVNFYLKHKDERLKLAKTIHKIIITNHSYKLRMDNFIKDIKKILT